jgi:hypothetical protein
MASDVLEPKNSDEKMDIVQRNSTANEDGIAAANDVRPACSTSDAYIEEDNTDTKNESKVSAKAPKYSLDPRLAATEASLTEVTVLGFSLQAKKYPNTVLFRTQHLAALIQDVLKLTCPIYDIR